MGFYMLQARYTQGAIKHLVERPASTTTRRGRLLPCPSGAELRDLTRPAFVLDHHERFTSRWHTRQAKNFDRHRLPFKPMALLR